jgi:hypothetical protein
MSDQGRETPSDALRREIREELQADDAINPILVEHSNLCSFTLSHVSLKVFRTRANPTLLHYRIFNVLDVINDHPGEMFLDEIRKELDLGKTSLTTATYSQIQEGMGKVMRFGGTSDIKIGAHSIALFKKSLHGEREDEPVGRQVQ